MGKKQGLGYNPADLFRQQKYQQNTQSNTSELGYNPAQLFREQQSNAGEDYNSGLITKQKQDLENYTCDLQEQMKDLDASDSEKNYVVDMALKGAPKEEIENAKLTIQGKHPLQQNEGFFGTKGYYLEDNPNGYKSLVPVNATTKIPKDKSIGSVWGTQEEAEDDNRLTDVLKKAYNVVPKTAQSLFDLGQAVYGSVTGNEADWYRAVKNTTDALQFKTNTDYDKTLIDTGKFHNFSDFLDVDNYDFSPSTIANTATTVGQSVLQFALTRGAMGTAGTAESAAMKTGQISKEVADKAIKFENLAKGFSASYLNNIGTAMNAANDLGITGQDAYLTALAVTIPVSVVDILGGGEGAINKSFEAETGKTLIPHLVKGFIKDNEGKITKEGLNDLFKTAYTTGETIAKDTPKTLLKTSAEEAGQEVGQNFLDKTSQVIHDNLINDENRKYGTELFSPKSVAEYLNDALGGLIGGAQGHVVGKILDKKSKDEEKDNHIMSAIQSGNSGINLLKTQLIATNKSGEINDVDLQTGLIKIDSYKKYAEAIKDTNLPEEKKKEIFNLTYEKANINAGIDNLEKNNVDGINDGLIKEKKEQVKDIENKTQSIWNDTEEKEEVKPTEPITEYKPNYKFTSPESEIEKPERKIFAENEHLNAEDFNNLDNEDKFHYIYDKLTNTKGLHGVQGILNVSHNSYQGASTISIGDHKIELASSDINDRTKDNTPLFEHDKSKVIVRPVEADGRKALAIYDENGHQIKNGQGRPYFVRQTEKSHGRSKYRAEDLFHESKTLQETQGTKLNSAFETWNLGELEGVPDDEKSREKINNYTRNPDTNVKYGETYNDFAKRVIGGYKKLLSSAKPNTVLVTHSQAIRLIKEWEKQGRPSDLSKLNKDAIIADEVPQDEIFNFKGDKGQNIYVVRHGDTTENNSVEGTPNKIRTRQVGLAPQGKETAIQLGKKLKPLNISDVVTSPLKRAKQTAIIIKKIVHGNGSEDLTENNVDNPIQPISKNTNLAENKGNENPNNQKKSSGRESVRSESDRSVEGTQSSKSSFGESNEGNSGIENAKLYIERSIGSTRKKQQVKLLPHEQEDIEKQSSFDYAKENGLWVDDLYSLGDVFSGGGNENTLAYNEDGKVVYKSNNLFNSNQSILQLLNQIEAHNDLFPESKYDLVGFTGHENGVNKTPYVEPIFKQDYVVKSVQATPKEIAKYMLQKGFKKLTDTSFTNGIYTVSDLHPRNVLKNDKGTIYVVDDIVTKNPVKEIKPKKQGLSKSKQKIVSPLYLKALNQEVFNAYDLALQYFINKGNVSPETIKDLYKNSRGELNSRISYIKKGAPSAEQIAEKLVSDNEGLNNSESDYLEAVIDIIQSFTSRSQMAEDLVNRYQTPKYTASEFEVNDFIKEAEKENVYDEANELLNASEELSDEEFNQLATDENAFNEWLNNNLSEENNLGDEGVYFQKQKEETSSFETRDGKPIGFNYDTDKVARQRFDISKLNKIGSGSDRDVYELGNGKVLKVAKTARGLGQNIHEGDYYLKGIIPEVFERGLNYVVAENTPSIKSSDVVPTYDIETNEENGTSTAGQMLKEIGRFSQRDFENRDSDIQAVINKYGFGDIFNYNVLWNDFTAKRNWGYLDGRPLHSDGGTFGGVQMLDEYKGVKNLDDADFREVYNKSKLAKKEFGDTDKNTMYQKPQKESSVISDKEIVDKVTSYLKKANPKLYIEFDENLQDKNGNKLWGQVSRKGNIKINPLVAQKDTPIHEVAHIFIDSIGGLENKVISKAVEQLKPTKLWEETELRYPELSEEMLSKEVLAEAIGREGANIFETEVAKNKFQQFLDEIYNAIKDVLGIGKDNVNVLAKKVLRGGIEFLTDKEYSQKIKEETKHFKAKPVTVQKMAYVRFGVSLNKLQEEKESLLNDKSKEATDRLKEIETFEKELDNEYTEYLSNLKKIQEILEHPDIENKSETELMDMYSYLIKYDDTMKSDVFKDIMYRIAKTLSDKQSEFLKSNGVDVDAVKGKDIRAKDRLLKALSHMTEAFPELQQLSKLWDKTYDAYYEEKETLSNELNTLAKEVVSEERKKQGLQTKAKEILTGDNSKYFSWMDVDGKLITTEQAIEKGYSDDKLKYLNKYKETIEHFKSEQEEASEMFQENSLIKSDKGFKETYKDDGLLAAVQNWVGNSKIDEIKMYYGDNKTLKTLSEINEDLRLNAKRGIISKAIAATKSLYYSIKAQKLLVKRENEDGSKLPESFYKENFINRRGKITNQYQSKEGKKNYSKDFHSAILDYVNDMSYTKNVAKILPYVKSIEYFNSINLGKNSNIVKWIKYWQDKHIFKQQKTSAFPELDLILKLLRSATSLTAMTFNMKAGLWNGAIGNYNSFIANGGKKYAIGTKRLVAKKGDGYVISSKARKFLEKNGVVSLQQEQDLKPYVGKLFSFIATMFSTLSEFQVQATQFLGQISKEDWEKIDKDGNYTGSDKEEFKERVSKYKNNVSDIQGKYSDKDRRNFELWEVGRFFGQFKTWLPDFIKERFGDKYYTRDGEVHYGRYRAFQEFALKELRQDISNGKMFTSDEYKYVRMRQNLKGALTTAILLSMSLSGSDDEKERKQGDLLSQATSNLLVIFSPSQLKFMITTPAAGMKTANDWFDTFYDALTLKEFSKDSRYGKKGQLEAPIEIAKLLPYHNLILNDYIVSDNK